VFLRRDFAAIKLHFLVFEGFVLILSSSVGYAP
jgi:hypothetical protein